jgi:hypothetical protein
MFRKYLALAVVLPTLAAAGTVPALARHAHRADPPAGQHLYNYAPGALGSPNSPTINDNPAFTGGGSAGYNELERKDR